MLPSGGPLLKTMNLPNITKAAVLRASANTPLYHDVVTESRLVPPLKPGQLLLKMGAVALNHRDVWIRQGKYRLIGLGSVMGADGAGLVVAASDQSDPLLNKRVFMTPMRGWKKHPDAPEVFEQFGVIGGVRYPSIGTFAEYVVVDRDEVVPSPAHLDVIQIAAWPLAGLTAWRAAMIHARVERGHNVLITGIGGGVALVALQLCLAKGANVFVTSGMREKIQKAMTLGATAGAVYNDNAWPRCLEQHLSRTETGLLDSVIDSGGGDIMNLTTRMLKPGGRVVCYGMTANPQITFTMKDVLAGRQLIGTSMGSLQDLTDATAFISEHKLVPIVSHVFHGLDRMEEAFELMKNGDQFGKIVVSITDGEADAEVVRSKL